MNNASMIEIKGVSKKFSTNLNRSMVYGIKDIAKDLVGMPTHSDKLRKYEFWALKNVSFKLQKGDALGIVGPNGSGKSTLLKMINGIIKPDEGDIRVRGRVCSLIEVGAGFHPMLSGRENIYVNGTILGMTRKEIQNKFDSIVEFADVGKFIDTPVKNYSSGMYVRLGFAVAAHAEPDVLLVDEVLAVGDTAFQKKCFRFIEEGILGKGVILCFVSHSIYTVARLCSTAMLLNQGEIKYYGDGSGVVPEYYDLMRSNAKTNKEGIESKSGGERLGIGEVRIKQVKLLGRNGSALDRIETGQEVKFEITVTAKRKMEYAPLVSLKVSDESGTIITYSRVPTEKQEGMSLNKGENVLVCGFEAFNLMPRHYNLEVKVGGDGDVVQDILHNAMSFEIVGDKHVYESTVNAGIVYMRNSWELIR